MKKLIILSGGLDSTILLYYMLKKLNIKNEDVIALSFRLQKSYIPNTNADKIMYQNNFVEIMKAKRTCVKNRIKHIILDVTYLNQVLDYMRKSEKHDSNSVNKNKQETAMPFRNMILLSNAFAIAQMEECDEIYAGYQKQDQYGYWDTNVEFIEKMNAVSILNPDANKVKIVCPFVNYSKSDEIKLAIEMDVFKCLADTWTCYNPLLDPASKEFISCGKCKSCKERLSNFQKLDLKDVIKYAQN